MRLLLLALLLQACSAPMSGPETGVDASRADVVTTSDAPAMDVQSTDARDVVDAQQVQDVTCGDGAASCSGSCVALNTTSNCMGCGNVCATMPNQQAVCHPTMGCIEICDGTHGDCSVGSDGTGNDADGCESLLNTPEHCGTCSTHCEGVTPNCIGGACSP